MKELEMDNSKNPLGILFDNEDNVSVQIFDSEGNYKNQFGSQNSGSGQ
jgi:hypothetical protein